MHGIFGFSARYVRGHGGHETWGGLRSHNAGLEHEGGLATEKPSDCPKEKDEPRQSTSAEMGREGV